MTTLPATILGLLRHCSPITANIAGWGKVSGVVRESDGKFWAHVAVGGVEVLVSRQVDADTFGLDLTDPTGFHHALLWLAEKLGMDARYGLLWCRVPRQDFDHGQYTPAYRLLAGATPDSDGVTLRSWQWVFTEESSDDPRCAEYFFGKDASHPPDGYTTVPSILSAGDTEALRLAILAVVGVEG